MTTTGLEKDWQPQQDVHGRASANHGCNQQRQGYNAPWILSQSLRRYIGTNSLADRLAEIPFCGTGIETVERHDEVSVLRDPFERLDHKLDVFVLGKVGETEADETRFETLVVEDLFVDVLLLGLMALVRCGADAVAAAIARTTRVYRFLLSDHQKLPECNLFKRIELQQLRRIRTSTHTPTPHLDPKEVVHDGTDQRRMNLKRGLPVVRQEPRYRNRQPKDCNTVL